MAHAVDLNCDMGEGIGADEALMPWISSANIACGGHAGDSKTIRTTIALAEIHGVNVGAHPGYEDPVHFGRTYMPMPMSGVRDMLRRQIDRIADAFGRSPHHVKPHGALYNASALDPELAGCIAETVAGYQSLLYVLAGSQSEIAARRVGLPFAREGFADRNYTPEGRLVPRTQPHALIMDATAAAAQAVGMVRDKRVTCPDGSELQLVVETICIHGDHPSAVKIARTIRRALDGANILVTAPHHG